MRAINIYSFTRNVDAALYPQFEKALSLREEKWQYKEHEIETLRLLVAQLVDKVKLHGFDNWFFSYNIASVQKEFDLLKVVKDDKVLNIELKSECCDKEKIIQQLRKNKHYLSAISQNVFCYTFVKNGNAFKVYKYENDNVEETTLQALVDEINSFEKAMSYGIEELFEPNKILVSPINDSEKFVEHQYYLTEQQENIKNEIVSSILANKKLYGISGGAGTGKTLLLYDIARELSETYKVAIIHCGILSASHNRFNDLFEKLDVYGVKTVFFGNNDLLDKYDVLCIDEAQRIYPHQLNVIIEKYKNDSFGSCVFSYDPLQVMAIDETEWNNAQTIKDFDGLIEKKLTGKIRQNKQLYCFIMKLMDNRIEISCNDFTGVDIVHADRDEEVWKIIDIYERLGYREIPFTPPYGDNVCGYLFSNDNNSHRVIGQEFEKVIVVVDKRFYYDERGVLCSRKHPNNNYLFVKLLYQNITRARERLCIIVKKNKKLFGKLLAIKTNSLDRIRD